MLRRLYRRRQWNKLVGRVQQHGLSACMDAVVHWVKDSPELYRVMYNGALDEYVEHLVGMTAKAAPRKAVCDNLTLLYQHYMRATNVVGKLEALVCLVTYVSGFRNSLVHSPTDVLLSYLSENC